MTPWGMCVVGGSDPQPSYPPHRGWVVRKYANVNANSTEAVWLAWLTCPGSVRITRPPPHLLLVLLLLQQQLLLPHFIQAPQMMMMMKKGLKSALNRRGPTKVTPPRPCDSCKQASKYVGMWYNTSYCVHPMILLAGCCSPSMCLPAGKRKGENHRMIALRIQWVCILAAAVGCWAAQLQRHRERGRGGGRERKMCKWVYVNLSAGSHNARPWSRASHLQLCKKGVLELQEGWLAS